MIGLIFGETNFPKEIYKSIKKKKIDYLIIDLTRNKVFKKDKRSHSVSIGQIGKIIDIIKSQKCKNILFAGFVKKPNFSKIRLDFKGVYYLPRILKSAKLGDAAILKEIINILKKEGINTLSSLTYNPELTLKKGIYTKTKPNFEDKEDIKIAIKTLNKIGDYNFSQGAVIRNKKVEVIEGEGGTQKMLQKCRNLKPKNIGVLVKFPKKKQDLRVDLPTIGLKTLIKCKNVGIKGIVVKSKKNIFLEKKKCINFANKNNMFIVSK
tara:strand:+ start:1103 stop:1897 length:795 start_codon:yes stop_codon:yes gene_type:complete